MATKRFLVTGAAGFIGSMLCRKLLDAGHSVIGADDLNDYYSPELKRQRIAGLTGDAGFHFHEVDICNRPALARLFDDEPPEVVFNMAARAGVRYSKVDPYVYMQTNIVGTLNILEEMRMHGVGKMILASTSSLYAGSPMPYVESLPVNEPLSPYAASKKGTEALCYSYHHLYGMDINIVRYFTVYGPAGRPDMSYFRFIHWIASGEKIRLYGDGRQSRDFTYVSDIVAGTMRAMKLGGYNIINLGGGKRPVSILDMIRLLEEQLGKTADIEFLPRDASDMESTWANIDKAGTLLDWKPEVTLEDGLAACVTWYRQNRDLVAQCLVNLK